jgi:hypothetical protein
MHTHLVRTFQTCTHEGNNYGTMSIIHTHKRDHNTYIYIHTYIHAFQTRIHEGKQLRCKRGHTHTYMHAYIHSRHVHTGQNNYGASEVIHTHRHIHTYIPDTYTQGETTMVQKRSYSPVSQCIVPLGDSAIEVCMHVCMCVRIYIYMYVCVYVCNSRVRKCIGPLGDSAIQVCVYVCVYINT